MALPAATVWEVRTTGSDTNGGGYAGGGTDYSIQDAKNTVGNNISTTDAVANGTTTLTSATGSFTSGLVGNVIYLQGGTGSLAAVRRHVATFTNATTVVLDATVASGTGITMNIGGCLASIGTLGSAIVAQNVAHIKGGSYSITSASNNVSGGCMSATNLHSLIGYTTTRLDFGNTRPVFTASGAISSFTIINPSSSGQFIANIEVDCASKSSSTGISCGARLYKCKVSNSTSNAYNNGGSAEAYYCEATGCSGSGAFNGFTRCVGCVAHDCTTFGFTGSIASLVDCIADTCTGASTDGFNSASASTFTNCTAYACGRDGFRNTSAAICINCIAESNVGIGFNMGALAGSQLINCATFGNGTPVSITGTAANNINAITGSSSFFTNAASADFSLNSTANAGALCRATGMLGTFPGGTTIGYQSVGAAQPAQAVGIPEVSVISG